MAKACTTAPIEAPTSDARFLWSVKTKEVMMHPKGAIRAKIETTMSLIKGCKTIEARNYRMYSDPGHATVVKKTSNFALNARRIASPNSSFSRWGSKQDKGKSDRQDVALPMGVAKGTLLLTLSCALCCKAAARDIATTHLCDIKLAPSIQRAETDVPCKAKVTPSNKECRLIAAVNVREDINASLQKKNDYILSAEMEKPLA